MLKQAAVALVFGVMLSGAYIGLTAIAAGHCTDAQMTVLAAQICERHDRCLFTPSEIEAVVRAEVKAKRCADE